jgi:hypothetical protein
MQVLRYFATPFVVSAEYVHLLRERIAAESKCNDNYAYVYV